MILVAVALLFFTPFFWSVSTSLKTLPESVAGLRPPARQPDARRLPQRARAEFNFARYTANSAFLAVTVTLCNLLLASLGGYAFARLRFPGREVLFMLVLATLMIPDQLRLVPVFLMLIDFPVTGWNLIGTYQGFVLINS